MNLTFNGENGNVYLTLYIRFQGNRVTIHMQKKLEELVKKLIFCVFLKLLRWLVLKNTRGGLCVMNQVITVVRMIKSDLN